jgi:hypothetical protein
MWCRIPSAFTCFQGMFVHVEGHGDDVVVDGRLGHGAALGRGHAEFVDLRFQYIFAGVGRLGLDVPCGYDNIRDVAHIRLVFYSLADGSMEMVYFQFKQDIGSHQGIAGGCARFLAFGQAVLPVNNA